MASPLLNGCDRLKVIEIHRGRLLSGGVPEAAKFNANRHEKNRGHHQAVQAGGS
jgi:hypothetical protein